MRADTKQLKVRLPSDLHDQVIRWATANKRSLNAEIVARIADSENYVTFRGNDAIKLIQVLWEAGRK